MRRALAAAGLAALCLTILGTVGCDDKVRTLQMMNKQQGTRLQEKQAEIAALQERVEAQKARLKDSNQLIATKNQQLQTERQRYQALEGQFGKLTDAYMRLQEGFGTAGAPAGGGVTEKLRMEIRALAEESPGMFNYDEQTDRLRFASDITFASGSNAVKPEAREALAKLAQILAGKLAKGVTVTVIGHTDSVPVGKAQTKALLKELGKPANNMGLSEARADSVKDILVGGGVGAGRIRTIGMGAKQPIPDAPKAKNRRVEIYLK